MQLEISIGINRSFISYNSEEERETFVNVSRELNKEYNKLMMNCGKVDDIILLFFLLIKTEIKLRRITYENVDNLLLVFLYSIRKYVQGGDLKHIRDSLVVINVVRRIELDRRLEEGFENEEENENMLRIKNFVNEICSAMETVEKNVLLS